MTASRIFVTSLVIIHLFVLQCKALPNLVTVRYHTFEFTSENEHIPFSKFKEAGNQVAPKIQDSLLDPDALYTIIMVDPDAPSAAQHTYRSWLHYLGSNLKPNSQDGELNLNAPENNIITKYNGPSPPIGSGPHHYQVYVFKQEEAYDQAPIRNRAKFNVENFKRSHSLELVGKAGFITER
nr:protein D1 [Ciona intestinalis]|eukprot:XP_002126707.1 protein D1 [Ciona intestinalis]